MMEIFQFAFCLALICGSFGFSGFNVPGGANSFKLGLPKPGPQKDNVAKAQGVLDEGVESLNTSVSGLTKRIHELETTGGKHAAEMQGVLKGMKGDKSNLEKEVVSVVSSIKTLEEKVAKAVEAQEKTVNDLASKAKLLESKIKNMKKGNTDVGPQNLALHKPTAASSELDPGGYHDGPVDGSVSTSFYEGTCFAPSKKDKEPWWQVDLEASYVIKEVKVTARGDDSPEMLHDFDVRVFADNPEEDPEIEFQKCNSFSDRRPKEAEVLSLNCTGAVTGRYVRIYGGKKDKKKDVLTFCEVQVFGEAAPDDSY